MTRSTQPGLRFRTRKLSPKQPLSVIREDQIDSDEYKELVDNQYKVETGVEKSEENVSLLFLVYVIPFSRDVIHFYDGQYHSGLYRPHNSCGAYYNLSTSLPGNVFNTLTYFHRNTISKRPWPLPSGVAPRRKQRR